MSPSNSIFSNGNISTPPAKNGFIGSSYLLNSEQAVQLLSSLLSRELMSISLSSQKLYDVSAVATELRRVTEGKVSAQAEDAEWKWKYELEKARNLQLEQNGKLSELNVERDGNLKDQPVSSDESSDQCYLCSVFTLLLSLVGKLCELNVERDGNLKDQPVSSAERSSKQISLKWESPPQTVFILTKPNSIDVRVLCLEIVRWLKEQKNMNIIVEPRVKAELLEESSFYRFVQTWLDDNDVLNLLVTLGGDGTVLWAASMFKGPVPPIVPLALGSLGFMTQFLILNLTIYFDN